MFEMSTKTTSPACFKVSPFIFSLSGTYFLKCLGMILKKTIHTVSIHPIVLHTTENTD